MEIRKKLCLVYYILQTVNMLSILHNFLLVLICTGVSKRHQIYYSLLTLLLTYSNSRQLTCIYTFCIPFLSSLCVFFWKCLHCWQKLGLLFTVEPIFWPNRIPGTFRLLFTEGIFCWARIQLPQLYWLSFVSSDRIGNIVYFSFLALLQFWTNTLGIFQVVFSSCFT